MMQIDKQKRHIEQTYKKRQIRRQTNRKLEKRNKRYILNIERYDNTQKKIS